MIKTVSHPKQSYPRLHGITPAKRASAQERNWQSLLDLTEPVNGSAMDFDDELVSLIDDCARRAIAE